MKLDSLLEKPKTIIVGILFLVTLVLYFVFMSVFQVMMVQFPTDAGLMAMKNAWTVENMQAIFSQWTPELFELMKLLHVWDLLFMVVYGILIFTGLLLTARGLDGYDKPQKFYLYSTLLAIIAVVLDLVEEVFIYIMLFNPTEITAGVVIGADLSTLICIILVYVGILLFLIGLIIVLILFLKNKK